MVVPFVFWIGHPLAQADFAGAIFAAIAAGIIFVFVLSGRAFFRGVFRHEASYVDKSLRQVLNGNESLARIVA
jgi:hypothetical protein